MEPVAVLDVDLRPGVRRPVPASLQVVEVGARCWACLPGNADEHVAAGMHEGLPGHSFVLIDKAGNQLWYGEYPSTFLSTADLLKEVRARLSS